MNHRLIGQATIVIKAAPSRVWEALTDPDLIRQYLFGSEVTTDWQVGSPITYKGTWEGKPYEDKGRILEIEPGSRLVSTFWSAFSGQPDLPENYQTVRYEILPEGTGTRLTITQEDNKSQEEADRAAENWKVVLEGMKKLLQG
jgi:uncharacterized protein YndB with AHSA1/START domain